MIGMDVEDEPTIDELYPARRLLDQIADKWTPIVLFCLASGTSRFGVMHRKIPGLSKKMLTQVLRRLERDGLVHRTVFRVVPPKTEYVLTDLGRRLHEPVAQLCRWAEDNVDVLDAIEQSRAEAESSEAG